MNKWVRCLALLAVMCCVMVSFGQDTTTADPIGDLFSGGVSSIVILFVILAIFSGLFGFNIPFLGGLFGN
ncbi:MAG: hypothetical protein IID33_16000 [Planctomycetes bacterium]|nr:hypothetical protein [Planctomycetota bacterium]